jgi:hypothetical protein
VSFLNSRKRVLRKPLIKKYLNHLRQSVRVHTNKLNQDIDLRTCSDSINLRSSSMDTIILLDENLSEEKSQRVACESTPHNMIPINFEVFFPS